MEEYSLKQDEVAERVSKSRAAVANSVRLLNLDERVQDMVVAEMISTGHARALLAITDPEVQFQTAQKVFDDKLTVRDVEKLVRRINEPAPSPVKKQISEALQAVYADLAEKMKASLGTKVSISPKSAQKGRIEIEYYSSDELDRLCSILNNLPQKEEG
jgi:ParB family chromosome partitioning protein